MFLKRTIQKVFERYLKFPVIALLGPRQSGKTTLVRHFFSDYTFVSLEDPSLREFARSDARGFLKQYAQGKGLIIDEFQYVPTLLSYIQLMVDEQKRPGFFVLTGSQNFLVNQAITQSLAGRVGILTLLPFSLDELKKHKLLPADVAQTILQGFYPRIYSEEILPTDFYPSYINTYIERDVRQLTNVGDLATFQKFLALCAGRIGQLLNLSELAAHCAISVPTASKWLSILEASYLVFRLQPYFKNFNKRLVKTPKLYFYDTGIACSLLRITNTENMRLSPFWGNLFENLVMSDLVKQCYNLGQRPSLYFWRDQNGTIEIDALIEKNLKLFALEMKASETITSNFFSNLLKWNEISATDSATNYLIYGGDQNQQRSSGNIIGWQSASDLVETL